MGNTTTKKPNSPNRRRRRQHFIEAFFAQKPISVHFAFAFDLDRSSRLDDVAAGILQSIAHRLRHMNAPGRTSWFHSVARENR